MEEKIRKALRKVIDPELNVSIIDLGLVYDVSFKDGLAKVTMTLTSMGCPLTPIIYDEVKRVLKNIKEVKKVKVKLVWDPPWSKDLMSEKLKAEFGF